MLLYLWRRENMRDILFALWGAAIASEWWVIGMGIVPRAGTPPIVAATILLSLGMLVFIIVSALNEKVK
jgi:hypothetical protein